MKCEKCKIEQAAHRATVYYGRIAGHSTVNKKVGAVTKSVTEIRYKEIKNKTISVCNKCMHRDKLWRILVVPMTIAILPIFFMIGVTSGGLSADEIAPIAYIIFLGPFLISVIFTAVHIIQKRYKDIKKVDVYRLAREQLKKHHKASDSSGRYSYWDEYPIKIHVIKY